MELNSGLSGLDLDLVSLDLGLDFGLAGLDLRLVGVLT